MMPSIDQAISFKDETEDDKMISQNFYSKRNSTPTPLLDSKVIKQRDMPACLYADFIESGTTDDIDLFLTRVTQMPQVSQNKMLQEKILFLNEKLCNVFEEIGNVRKFHTRTSRFLKALRNKINTQK